MRRFDLAKREAFRAVRKREVWYDSPMILARNFTGENCMANTRPKMIVWSDKLRIDDGVIDNDHKYLIELSNEFVKNGRQFDSKDQAQKLINNLLYYTSTHFRREEKIQKQIGFPNIIEHKNEHLELENKLRKINDMIRDAESSDLNLISIEVTKLFRKWLIKHILKHDMLMREYAEEIRSVSTDIAPIGDVAYL